MTEGSTSSLTLRRYRDLDLDAVWTLHVLGLEQFGANAGHGPWDDDLKRIGDVYLSSGGDFLMGELKGRVVAMGGVRPTSATRAELKRMRVHPDFQRRGFGQLILDALERRARDLSFRTLHLDTTVSQIPAQRLYLKNGFQEVGRGRLGGLDSILYEKDISEDSPRVWMSNDD